jgi:hypothetical protein
MSLWEWRRARGIDPQFKTIHRADNPLKEYGNVNGNFRLSIRPVIAYSLSNSKIRRESAGPLLVSVEYK